jgi:uncharacterized protein
MSYPFKICDPIHGFIRFGNIEQQVIDSKPFQRLRYIRQMGVAYLVYPGATHSRFEHSLGVMDLATRIYNTLIASHNQIICLDKNEKELDYWRQILRLAALCHDLGHLPFSHTAERSLLADGGHEAMTAKLIRSAELHPIWKQIGHSAEQDICKLAASIGKENLSPWERVLSQIITEDNFGADRIDYLIRDGHYTGVGYGHFDYHQLIDTLRILPEGQDLSLGVLESGIQSVESLWIARYMMYSRVYHHPKARLFTNHMHRFMEHHYKGKISDSVEDYLKQTDYTLLASLSQAADEANYDAACLLKRETPFCEVPIPHNRAEALQILLNKISHQERSNLATRQNKVAEHGEQWAHSLDKKSTIDLFSGDIFIDFISKKEGNRSFPIYAEDGSVISSLQASTFLREIPCGVKSDCLYVHPQKYHALRQWLKDHCGFDA